MSSLSTSLKNSYQKWLHPYEEYLRAAKPGVQQQLELEYGGPFTPSAADSPRKRSNQDPPAGRKEESSSIRVSAPSSASRKETDEGQGNVAVPAETPRPTVTTGFTAINSSGFTPVNLTSASFQAVNGPSASARRESENGLPTVMPRPLRDGSLPPGQDAREHRNPNVNQARLTNGSSLNPLKRAAGHDSMNGVSGTDTGASGDGEDPNGRRSKRIKKGKPEVHSSAQPTCLGELRRLAIPT